MNNVLKQAIGKVSRKLCVDPKIVENVYDSYWKFIKHHVEALPLDGITEEEFNKLTTNFNLPYIGKFYVTYQRIENRVKQRKYYNYVKSKRNKADRDSSIGEQESL